MKHFVIHSLRENAFYPYRLLAAILMLVGVLVSGCQGLPLAAATPTTAATPTATLTPLPTSTMTFTPSPVPARFDGERAWADVEYQVNLGPRTPDSPGHEAIRIWMQDELTQAGWEVEVAESTWKDKTVYNLVARRGAGKRPWIVLGAHYDSRMEANKDPDEARRKDPVPGANDGGSGVAILLELARVLPADLDKEVWLTFFDLEDQGSLPGYEWIIGSTVLAESMAALPEKPDAVVIVDMVGDANLNLPMERNSDQELVKEIWSVAAELGYGEQFIQEPGYSMLDDHTPFLNQGMRAIDIIDFDYPYWHTTSDTSDKVSADSLMVVGDTLYEWIVNRR